MFHIQTTPSSTTIRITGSRIAATISNFPNLRVEKTRQRYLVILTALSFALVAINSSLLTTRPSHFPPISNTTTSITLQTFLQHLQDTPKTPLHKSYKTLATCNQTIHIPALPSATNLHTTPSNIHPFVACLARPVTPSFLDLVQKLSRRLGNPFITTNDHTIISELTHRNITPILPASPDDALIAMAAAASLLVQGNHVCAIGASLATGVVYYTQNYLAYFSEHGYQWKPLRGARLDAIDRSHRAILNALGRVQHSCCIFNNALCHPLPNPCKAVVMGNLRQQIGCTLSYVCSHGVCPSWKQIVEPGIPDLLIMDISGKEFHVLNDLCATHATHELPKQIVMRMSVWADRDLGHDWARRKHGWAVSRSFVQRIVATLAKRGYTLVYRVDDPSCEWCAFVTFLRAH